MSRDLNKRTFDISIAFDKSKYLDKQIKLFADTIYNKIPSDTTLHIVTNRERDDINLLYLLEKVENNKLYYKEPPEIISRCKYLLNAIEVETKADYLVRMDLDIIPLKNVKELIKQLVLNEDLYIQMENRRVIPDDNVEARLWRQIYRAMNIKVPNYKISYVENQEIGLPLFNTGVFVINTNLLYRFSKDWKRLTNICEKWIDFNIHPNEFAFTGLVFDSGIKFSIMGDKEVFNPIGHFRKGSFPSTELTDNCKIPAETILLHWHKPRWLKHLHKYNNFKELQGLNYLDDSFWNVSEDVYKETYGL